MNRWHGVALTPFLQDLTITIKTQPADTIDRGGKYLSSSSIEYDVLGIFMPEVSSMLLPTPTGDIIVSVSEVQISKKRLDALLITPATLINKIGFNGRSHTVMDIEDYTHINGCYQFKVIAELDKDAY